MSLLCLKVTIHILINSSGVHLLSQQIFTESFQVAGTALDAGTAIDKAEKVPGMAVAKQVQICIYQVVIDDIKEKKSE